MGDATVIAIEKLGGFLAHQINIRAGVKDSVRWLKDELSYLQSSLRAAEEMEETDQILPWIDNVKDVVNDAVNILEKFSNHQDVHLGSEHGILDHFRILIRMCKKQTKLYDIGKEIESLKERVAEMKKRRKDYGINDILTNQKVQHKKRRILRETSFQNHVDVVGFEDDFNILLAKIVGNDPTLSVISIHGMGGLGKSRLASQLYHSNELRYFELRGWVCVSKDYNIKDILQKLIKSLVKKRKVVGLSQMNVIDLLRHLRNLLLGSGSYLVVIDDVWKTEAWESIKMAFPDKEDGSRVVITTRYEQVAQRVDDNGFVHKLCPLGEDESWQLFCKVAKPTRNLDKLGKEMVCKCQGLPLSIIVLSGLLVRNKSYKHWLKVKDHLLKNLKEDSIKITEILSLCYDDLNTETKQCFSYIARFPEDHIFQVDQLRWLLMAEELISVADKGYEAVLEDLADDYICDLINHDLIQVESFLLNRQVYEFRIHNLVRDLVILKAPKNKSLNILDLSKQRASSTQFLHGQPGLSVYDGTGEYFELFGPTFDDDSKLRSLALVNGSGILKMEELKLMYTKFEYLKVLDLTEVASDGIPQEIGDLFLLKFLGLIHGNNRSDILVIPPTVGKLKKLQTLCGSADFLYKFPREISELKELRHINFGHFQDIDSHLKISSQQTKLQTLESIWYEDWKQIDPDNFTNLRYLALGNNASEDIVCTLDSVAKLTNLQRFYFDCCGDVIPTIKPLSLCKCLTRVYLSGTLQDTNDLKYLPDSVTFLTLFCSDLTEDPMTILGSLSNLTSLVLDMDAYMGKKMVCNDDAFSSLEYLIIEALPHLEEWQVQDGSMPSLKGLNIIDCDNLKIVPKRIKGLPPIPSTFVTWLLS